MVSLAGAGQTIAQAEVWTTQAGCGIISHLQEEILGNEPITRERWGRCFGPHLAETLPNRPGYIGAIMPDPTESVDTRQRPELEKAAGPQFLDHVEKAVTSTARYSDFSMN